MDTNTLFRNGAVWLRADFHLHTKADDGFTYNGKENDFNGRWKRSLPYQTEYL